MSEKATSVLDTQIVPMCGRVLICKDDDKNVTKGGIILPDNAKIEVITGRVVELAADLEDNPKYEPMVRLDRVIVNPSRSIPVEIEPGNKLFIIPVEDVVAVFKKRDLPDEDN